MQSLRWTLGVIAVVVGGGWLAVAALGRGFRSSFGASAVGPFTQLGPALVMGLALASVVAPHNRVLLHTTAVVLAAACVGLIFVLRESTFVGVAGLLYCAAWFLFYAKAL
ncbi:MAG: hypothetical protein IPJ17_11185 [Holophagales bacterium]|nr:MAG: hypothetical protein IPJ17_11185 [Holophagales bacterium]